jgi:hypothetical protein
MNVLTTALVILMSIYGPDPVPDSPVPEVPFPYDPNLVQSPVFDSEISTPGSTLTYQFAVVSEKGVNVPLSGVEIFDGNTPLNVTIIKEEPNQTTVDVNSVAVNVTVQPFSILWTPLREGVVYLNIRTTNIVGRSDERTLLILLIDDDDQPHIYPMDSPSISVVDAQEIWQYAVWCRNKLRLWSLMVSPTLYTRRL